MKALQSVYKLIINILKVITITTLALMTITVFYSVIARFILNNSLAWAEELSRFLMMWMTLSGAVIAYEEGKHMSFDSLVRALPKPVQLVIQLASYALIFWLLANMSRGGVTYAKNSWAWRSPALHIPYGRIYLIAPISLGMMAIQSVVKFIKTLLEAVKGSTEENHA